MKWICKILGHRVLILPFLPQSFMPDGHQDWYDTICTRCGGVDTIRAGRN